jgi:hypothetical protein
MGGLLKPKMPNVNAAPPPEPKQAKVAVPTRDDPRVKHGVRRRAREDEKERRGRRSTNLAQGAQPTYQRSQLG